MPLPTLDYELNLWNQGYKFIAGLDEAGRGPLAGPMVAAAIIFDPDLLLPLSSLPGIGTKRSYSVSLPLPKIIRDSKTLSKKQREEAFEWIQGVAYAIGVGRVENTEIDKVGLTQAEQLAFSRSLQGLKLTNYRGHGSLSITEIRPDYYLVDAFTLKYVDQKIQQGIIKGDQKVFTIAAASIIAKVTRDNIMTEFANEYPRYGFEKHVGYGTKYHLEMLVKHGPCPIHRRNFAPIRKKGPCAESV